MHAGRGGSGAAGGGLSGRPSTTARGEAAEQRALGHLLAAGLTLIERHYRVTRPGGEIDLVMRAADGTVVCVEVRARRSFGAGGAAASVGPAKRARLLRAATALLSRWAEPPPLRFDVVAIEGDRLEWIVGAFDAGEGW